MITCRRVFNWNKHDPALTPEDRLNRAHQHRFLFDESQSIDKPIQHLKYLRLPPHISPKDTFSNPRFIRKRKFRTTTITVPDDKETIDGQIITYNFVIPKDLIPFVPNIPVYASDQDKRENIPIRPGSKTWLQLLEDRKALHNKQEQERRKTLAAIRKRQNILIRQQEQKNKRLIEAKSLYTLAAAQDAKLLGTTIEYLPIKELLTEEFTQRSHKFHNMVSEWIKFLQQDPLELFNEIYVDMKLFDASKFFDIPLYKASLELTSPFELRTNKRNTDNIFFSDSLESKHIDKRPRYTSISDMDCDIYPLI
ncbi:unnamed protein product [Rhizophagus irregularis]|nr:unnamed protein product [Rhizophagus irregularis]